MNSSDWPGTIASANLCSSDDSTLINICSSNRLLSSFCSKSLYSHMVLLLDIENVTWNENNLHWSRWLATTIMGIFVMSKMSTNHFWDGYYSPVPCMHMNFFK